MSLGMQNQLFSLADIKGLDKPVPPHRLIIVIVVHFLESKMALVSKANMPSLPASRADPENFLSGDPTKFYHYKNPYP